MKYILALSVTFLLHYLLYNYLDKKNLENPKVTQKNEIQKQNLQYVKILPKAKKIPLAKKVIPKKIIEKKLKKIEKKKKLSPQKKIVKKIKKELPSKKIVPKPIPKKNTISKKTILENYYKKENTPEEKKKVIKEKKFDKHTQSFIDLYGKEFNHFDEATKLYLIKNIKNIGEITQRFLEYPTMSIQAQQSGISVVEFMLYPDGKIEHLKTISSSGYFLLDDNTLETIEEAYSDYPRPTKKTKIKIYVQYKLLE